eukprot:14935879-Heterocapsa_arctica.AAC.1
MPVRDDDAMMIDVEEPGQEEMIDAMWKGKGNGAKAAVRPAKAAKAKARMLVRERRDLLRAQRPRCPLIWKGGG